MIRNVLTLLFGFVFALGLGISQMSRPQKVLAFLDVFHWDPSLLFVMGGAIAVYYPLYRLIMKREHPLFAEKFTLPTPSEIDKKLIIGPALFGIGWGLAGLCPGPAVVALTSFLPETFIFFLGLGAGIYFVKLFKIC